MGCCHAARQREPVGCHVSIFFGNCSPSDGNKASMVDNRISECSLTNRLSVFCGTPVSWEIWYRDFGLFSIASRSSSASVAGCLLEFGLFFIVAANRAIHHRLCGVSAKNSLHCCVGPFGFSSLRCHALGFEFSRNGSQALSL